MPTDIFRYLILVSFICIHSLGPSSEKCRQIWNSVFTLNFIVSALIFRGAGGRIKKCFREEKIFLNPLAGHLWHPCKTHLHFQCDIRFSFCRHNARTIQNDKKFSRFAFRILSPTSTNLTMQNIIFKKLKKIEVRLLFQLWQIRNAQI